MSPTLAQLRREVAKLRAGIPAKKKPFVVIFENADGTFSGGIAPAWFPKSINDLITAGNSAGS
jgi:hypothetical protein